MSADTLDERPRVGRANPAFDVRLSTALTVGKMALLASRRLGVGGGTALPGVLATKLDTAVLVKLTRALPRGTTLVTGTNGKTTTSRLLAAILEHDGWRPVHNRAGSNMVSGLTTALIERSNLVGRTDGDSALLEVDEAVMPHIVAGVQPRVLVLTNLFRDQLDRYGEVDFVANRWKEALRGLSEKTTVVLNADDPAVAALGRDLRSPVLYFGIDAPDTGSSTLSPAADSKNCPFCGTPLRYNSVRYAHVGDYTCPGGDFARPNPDVAVRALTLQGIDATEVDVRGPFGDRHWTFRLPGLYNAYNLLAAATGAIALGVSLSAIEAGVSGFSAAFGRLERVQVGDRTLFFALIKNPVGFTEVLRTLLVEPGQKHVAIFINDNLADGTDVSWLWDADVEVLAGRCERVVVSGTRAGDMAVRLKYAGVPVDRIHQIPSTEQALDDGLKALPPGGTLYVLPTYTAMLDLRTLVSRRGHADRYWET